MSQYTYETNFPEVIAAIENAAQRGLARIVSELAEQARRSGSYDDRTTNLRTLITPNIERSDDVPENQYTCLPVTYFDNFLGVEVADIKYLPPEDFYIPKVEAMGVEITARVSALMPYAAAVESRGYDVLSQVFTGFISNPQQYFSEIQDEIARNEVASSLTVRQG
jgi:hypothetical protein